MRASLLFAFVLSAAACSSSSAPSGSSTVADSGSVSSTGDSGASGDTWENYAAGFFTAYCTSCHNSSDPTGRDFTVQATVLQNEVAMRCGVAVTQDPSWKCAASPVAEQFPIGNGPKPTDAERDRIVAWITAGEP
jgi:hypothetical protein